MRAPPRARPPATYAEALESMRKVTFHEFRAFCNAVVEEADEQSSSCGGSVDGAAVKVQHF